MVFVLVSLVGITVGYLFSILWCKATKPIEHLARPKGYHLHHSFLGILAVILAFGLHSRESILVFFFGTGIILHHFLTEGDVKLITKP